MQKKDKSAIIFYFLIGFLIVFIGYKKYSFACAKEQIPAALEAYRTENLTYPENLKMLNIEYTDDFHYFISPDKYMTYSLSYDDMMGINTVFYNLDTKKWEKRFNY
jgi:hypothetical protein